MKIEWQITHDEPRWDRDLLYTVEGHLLNDAGFLVTMLSDNNVEERNLAFIQGSIRDDLLIIAEKYNHALNIIKVYSEPEVLEFYDE